jgi:hypothetical protein
LTVFALAPLIIAAAARAKTRDRLIYCRALAAHLASEASELERVSRSNAPREQELVSAD